jgi:hypothetical protein
MLMWLLEAWLRRNWRPGPGLERYLGMTALTVVTGSSEGIGLAIARELARRGHDLLLVARRPEPLAAAAQAIRAASGVEVATLAADLSTPDGVEAVARALAARNAYCDILVNNAAMGLAGPFADQAHADVQRLVDLNVRALSELMHTFLPGMLERGRGGILNVASLGGYVPGPWQAAYYASKAYVISLTEAVAHETRGQGVRIAVVAPGPVATEFHRRMGAETAYYAIFRHMVSAERVARSSCRWYHWGRTVIVPGRITPVTALAARVLPHVLLVPLVGWLLRRRG